MEKRYYWKKLTTVLLTMLVAVFLLPTGLQYAFAAVSAPAAEKNMIDNGDGTYTLTLSVTGQAESGTVTEVTKANVIIVMDTSSSMNGNDAVYNGTTMSRINAEKRVLCDDNGVIDQLLAKNTSEYPDIIDIAVVNFGRAGGRAQDWSHNATAIKNSINGLSPTTGTNWEEGLQEAQTLASESRRVYPDEDVYIIFMTDGEPTTHENDYSVSTNYPTEWGYAADEAEYLATTAGCHFYAIFTFTSNTDSGQYYLASLVNRAYSGSGTATTITATNPLPAAYQQYFYNATQASDIVNALNAIISNITTDVGFTNVELEDGVTSMTTSNIKTAAGGEVTNMKYYRKGGSYSTTANNGLGEVWTDAPHATVNSSNVVDWDLKDLVLEDGVTYTVAFVVWPSQESLDLVADLNNGLVDYDSLTADQKSQIAVSSGHYTLKTNKAPTQVTYSTVTKKTVDGQAGEPEISDPITVPITDPEPVGLAEYQMNAVKSWEDSLDESQREEISDVVLYLLIDGEYYKDAEGNKKGVKLTEASNWTETNYISIAPGLLVTEDSPAYDPDAPQFTWDGKKWAMLEKGHEYVFEEEDINGHYELTAYTHHPMTMTENGKVVVKDVFFTKDASGNLTGIESVEALGSNISATNTIKGGINISKKVVDESGEEINDLNPFTVKVTMTDADGNKLPDKTANGSTYNIDYRIYYGENNPAYETSGDRHRSDHIYVSGTEFTETIYVGDVIRVVNVEDGTVYTVDEEVPTGYAMDPVEYKIVYGTSDESQADVDPDHTVQGNSASFATITNKYTSGDLEVSKKVDIDGGDADKLSDKEFEFTFKLFSDEEKTTELEYNRYSYTKTDADGKETTGTITEGGTFTLKDGEKYLIKQLPENAYYEVTETAVDGFTASPEGGVAAGTITDGEKAEAAFTNTYSMEPVSVDPPVQKIISGNDDLYNKGDFTFTITNTAKPDGVTAPMPAKTSVKNQASDELQGKKGYYEFGEIKFTAPGSYTYQVTESGSAPGVINDPDASKGKTITFTVTDNGDGTLTVTPPTDSAVFSFTNTYEPGAAPATVKVEKTLDGRELKEGEFSFKMVPTKTVEGDPVTADGLTGTVDAKGVAELSATYDKVGTYEYEVSEVVPEKKLGGVTYDEHKEKITVTVTDNKEKGTLEAKVSPETVTFKNEYKTSGDAEIDIKKVFEGKNWTDEEFKFELYEGDKKIDEKTLTSKDEDGKGKFVIEGLTPGEYKYTVKEVVPGAESSSEEQAAPAEEKTEATEEPANTSGQPAEAAAPEETVEAAPAEEEAVEAAPAEEELTVGDFVRALFITAYAEDSTTVETDNGTITYDEKGATEGYEVAVKVTDNGDGTCTVAVTYPDGDTVTFTNQYEPNPATLNLEAKKTLSGMGLTEGMFQFKLSGEGVNETVSNDADGNVKFSQLSYTKDDAGKTFKYTVEEVAGSQTGVTYDTTKYDVEVKVAYDEDTGALSATASDNAKSLTFKNTFVPEKVTVYLSATKTLEGADLYDGEFAFIIRDDSGNIRASGNNDASGKVEFGGITFTEAGTYKFTIEEVNSGLDDIVYDSTKYNVTITVTEKDGKLTSSVAIEGGPAAFNNTYEPPEEPDEPDKPKKKKTPDTGDSNDLAGLLTLMGTSAAGLAYLFIRRRREDYL